MKKLIIKTDFQNEIDYHLEDSVTKDIIRILDFRDSENSPVTSILLGFKTLESHLFETVTITIINEKLYSVNGDITIHDINLLKNIINSYYSN